MDTFYPLHQRIPFIRRAFGHLPEPEVEKLERLFFAYLDLTLRVFEAIHSPSEV